MGFKEIWSSKKIANLKKNAVRKNWVRKKGGSKIFGVYKFGIGKYLAVNTICGQKQFVVQKKLRSEKNLA